MASIKLRQGKSMDMNKWLRVRVGAQAFTVVAICGYAYRQGALRKQTAPEEEAKKAKKASDEFKERLKGAEEAFKAENAAGVQTRAGSGEVVKEGRGKILGEVERAREESREAERARANLERVEKDGSEAGSEGVVAPGSTTSSGSSWKSWFGFEGGSGSSGKPS